MGVLADYPDNSCVDNTWYHNGLPVKVKDCCTDVFFAVASRFIESSTEQNKPFFVYLATSAPHGPHICPPSHSRPCETERNIAISRNSVG